MGLLDLALGLLFGGGDEPAPRPQGPGLNIGEGPLRKQIGLPTTAQTTRYATSSGPGTGRPAPAQKPAQPRSGGAKRVPRKFISQEARETRPIGFDARHTMGAPVTGTDVQDFNRLAPIMEKLLGGVDKSQWVEPSYQSDARDAQGQRDRMLGGIGDGLGWFNDNVGNAVDDVNHYAGFTEKGWGRTPKEQGKLVKSGKAKKGNGGINWNPFDGKL